MRRTVRIGSLVVAVLCFVAFFNYERLNVGENTIATDSQTLGLTVSPWFEYERRHSRNPLPTGGWLHKRTERGRIVWRSWSWLVLACGLAAAVAFYRLRSPETGATPHEYRDQAGAPEIDLRDPR